MSAHGFYVTARDGGRHAILLGPFDEHEHALAQVDRGRKLAGDAPRAAFWAFGTSKISENAQGLLPLGALNARADIGLQTTRLTAARALADRRAAMQHPTPQNEQGAAMTSDARQEFLADIIIGAVEGGTGYWACVSEYKHERPSETRAVLHEEDPDGAIQGNGGSYSTTPLVLTPDAIATALGRIRRGEIDLNSALQITIMQADSANDAGEIDSDAADVVAQVALLGSIVYG